MINNSSNSGNRVSARDIQYLHDKSGLAADNLQDAIDEIANDRSNGSSLKVTFEAAFVGQRYTVTDGDDTKTGIVPEGGIVSVSVVNCNSTYTIKARADDDIEYFTTVTTGPYFGRYTTDLHGFRATVNILSPAGATITCVGNGKTQSIVSTGEDAIIVHKAGTYTITRNKDGKIAERELEVTEYGETVSIVLSMRYGYRKTKAESNPETRITYLYDAVGMTPAKMDFSTETFDYGDWGDVFFVKKNKPVMLKYDRTVDYELNHSDQTKKLDGTPSDISNTSYAGNAMSEIPLGWVLRYEDEEYEYEIVCEHQWDADYKAYAHTRADGSIADCFYWSMFGGSGSASKIRSLAGRDTATLTAQNEINGCKANGEGWYTHTWSQHEYIRTLLLLMGKSTDTQAIFGNGNCRNTSTNAVLQTGTIKGKGQFFGYNSNTQQVKVFYIEGFWGDQMDRIAGLINDRGTYYVKMTPEGQGYRVTDTVDMDKLEGISVPDTRYGYINKMHCSEFGCVPITVSGSESTYECDAMWSNNDKFCYILTGSSAWGVADSGGAFAVDASAAPSEAYWHLGCGLSAEQPLAKEEDE